MSLNSPKVKISRKKLQSDLQSVNRFYIVEVLTALQEMKAKLLKHSVEKSLSCKGENHAVRLLGG